jgi:pimeloyl-ACP methyl ester carboxylesterase
MDARFTPAHRGGDGEPLVLLHGFTGSWRVWELVLPALERRHDVLAPTLPGHAGGPALEGELSHDLVPDAIERVMDAAGFGTAHIVGNSLGGYVALRLAARGRARSVVALAPAGGWAAGDESYRDMLRDYAAVHELAKAAAPHAQALASTPQGRRRATEWIAENGEDIPPSTVADLIRATAGCDGAPTMIDYALRHPFTLEAERVDCPLRIVWGTEDKLLAWPSAAARYRRELHADWVELDGVGHCPQLDVPLETAQLVLGFTS